MAMGTKRLALRPQSRRSPCTQSRSGRVCAVAEVPIRIGSAVDSVPLHEERAAFLDTLLVDAPVGIALLDTEWHPRDSAYSHISSIKP